MSIFYNINQLDINEINSILSQLSVRLNELNISGAIGPQGPPGPAGQDINILSGLDAAKPMPIGSGNFYWATDTEKMYYDPPL